MLKKFIIIVVILIVIGLVFFFVFKKNILITREREIEKEISQLNFQKKVPEIISRERSEKDELILQARSFIERFGSFSSDSGLLNIKELESIMSNDFKEKARKEILSLQKGNEFFSLKTKILSLKTDEYIPDEKAIFKANIQQEEIKGKEKSIKYKTIKVIFNKIGKNWKVVDYLEIK